MQTHEGSGQTHATGFKRNTMILAISLLLIVVVFRGVILFTGQRYLRSDEAVVGLMAKHIFTRGERPVYMYGQHYGGGHAIVAYIAAPLFAMFGKSAVLLGAITVTISVVNLLILWLILRRYFNELIALAGTGLYAFNPPVVYQSFLINGNTESICLSLLALMFFLRSYIEGHFAKLNALIAGIFIGLAYYAMDYALLYAIIFVLLWLTTRTEGKWKCLGVFFIGLFIGYLPVLMYNITHDFANLRFIFRGDSGTQINFLSHLGYALWHTITGDIAVFFTGDIDDFSERPIDIGSWIHAGIAIAAVTGILFKQRNTIIHVVKNWFVRKHRLISILPVLIPPIFIVVYILIYCSVKISLDHWKSPRYFLPLCPFISITIALFLLWEWNNVIKKVGLVICLFLIIRGAVVSMESGLRPWHEEHKIQTSGEEIKNLARLIVDKNIRIAHAPYEIMWRLMFETDERVIIANDLISPFVRYPYYSEEVYRRIESGDSFALIFRNDYAFSKEYAPKHTAQNDEIQLFRIKLMPNTLKEKTILSGEEFVVFYPLRKNK